MYLYTHEKVILLKYGLRCEYRRDDIVYKKHTHTRWYYRIADIVNDDYEYKDYRNNQDGAS